MDNLYVVYGSKWNNSKIIDMLVNDSVKNYIFTLIEKDKILEINNIIKQNAIDLKIIEYDLSTLLECNGTINNNNIVYDSQLKIMLSKSTVKSLNNSSQILNKIKIGIYSAGMSEVDIVTIGFIYMKLLGYDVYPKLDLGVDNIKKTKQVLNEINNMDIIIVTAGMEAILPTVLAHITYKPIVAVPSNVSYGYGANGIAGIYSILMSDAPGIAVFNIGNIYGACIFCHRIGKYLLKRTENPNKNMHELFQPKYQKNIKFVDDNKTIKLTDEYTIIDTISGIRINYPLINLNNKEQNQIQNFIDSHKYVILRDNRIERSKYTIDKKFYKYAENLYSNIEPDFITERAKLYDTSKPILIVCGGMSDLKYAKEFQIYMKLNSIKCDIIESFDMNQVILYENQLISLKTDYDICVVIASMNGTISNIVGGFLKDLPVIAVPVGNALTEVHDERNTLMSMLNNCVGGIAVVEKNNLYSAACLVLSILFNYCGDVAKLAI